MTVEVAKYQDQLPATIEELQQYVLVGEQQIKAHQAKLAAIKRIPQASIFEAAALKEAQAFAEVVICATAKLGELLAATVQRGTVKGSHRGTLKSLPAGITKKESHKAQSIYNHPEAVEEVIAKAKEQKSIPTPSEVYKKINKRPARPKSATWDFTKAKHDLYMYLRREYDRWPQKSQKVFIKIVNDILEDICHDRTLD